MKKVLAYLAFPLCFVLALFSTKYLNAGSPSGEISYAEMNLVTCYSAWSQPGLWTIYDCGPCTKVTLVKDFIDPGECDYAP